MTLVGGLLVSASFAVGSFWDVLSTIVGVVLGLAGLATAIMCLMALTEGAIRRGSAGLVAGLALLLIGLYLVGMLPI